MPNATCAWDFEWALLPTTEYTDQPLERSWVRKKRVVSKRVVLGENSPAPKTGTRYMRMFPKTAHDHDDVDGRDGEFIQGAREVGRTLQKDVFLPSKHLAFISADNPYKEPSRILLRSVLLHDPLAVCALS